MSTAGMISGIYSIYSYVSGKSPDLICSPRRMNYDFRDSMTAITMYFVSTYLCHIFIIDRTLQIVCTKNNDFQYRL
jgi:hypothetical protein